MPVEHRVLQSPRNRNCRFLYMYIRLFIYCSDRA